MSARDLWNCAADRATNPWANDGMSPGRAQQRQAKHHYIQTVERDVPGARRPSTLGARRAAGLSAHSTSGAVFGTTQWLCICPTDNR
jgi:hypothetical protein